MIDNLEPLRIPGFRVWETGETGETHAIKTRKENDRESVISMIWMVLKNRE